MRTVWKDESRFMEAFGMGKDLSEMTLEELWAYGLQPREFFMLWFYSTWYVISG